MKIATLLPLNEGFSPDLFGAVSLYVRDYISLSSHQHLCMGSEPGTLAGITYRQVSPDNTFFQNFLCKSIPFRNKDKLYVLQAIKVLKNTDIDLIEVHNRPDYIPILRKYLPLTPISLYLHNEKKFLHPDLANQCQAIFTVSNFLHDTITHQVDVHLPVITAYNGITLPASGPDLAHKKKQIIFIGRLTKNKGALPLIQALNKFLGENPDWQGIVIGPHSYTRRKFTKPDSYCEQCLEAINTHGLIRYHEFVENEVIRQLCEESAISVTPAMWSEPFGRTSLEALASGCALISSLDGGLREVVGEACYALSTVTQESIYHALCYLTSNPARIRELQLAGLKQAEKFNLQNLTLVLDRARQSLHQPN